MVKFAHFRTLRPIAIALAASFVFSGVKAANQLADSQSPYLLQHADNPVDWYPWGPEAFAKAEAEKKLIFVSIGYSTCHWCHVMNRESFSDEEIAAYLNDHYVCIKIDREERPDIDNVYMTFVQNIRGAAGWPLNVFLTPDKKPFFGGTYYPPRNDPERGGGFLELIKEIQGFWIQDSSKLLARSEQIVNALKQSSEALAGSADSISLDLVATSITSHFFTFDDKNKGFGKGEKFPTPTSLSFLLRSAATPEIHTEDRELAQRLALETLNAICAGGIRDHLGGGFHRYTVDPAWQLPHFEKMLYDQALLAKALVDAWQLTGETRYQQAATDALDYLLRDMRHANGGFYSAEDAESPDPEKPDTKREGAYYLWTTEELESLIPNADQRAFLTTYFAISSEGNAPTGDFPSNLFDGYNTLRIERSLSVVAEQLQVTTKQASDWLKDGVATLRQARAQRQRPHLDDKIVTSWNGLVISALARAAQAFDRPDYAEAATQAATFLLDKLWDESTGRLSRLYRQGPSPVSGFAEDYAYLIEGFLDLYEATANHQWIKKAEALQLAQNQRFHDAERGGFFLFEESDDIVFGRPKRIADAALPSPNAVSAKNLARLSQIFDDKPFQKMATDTVAALLSDFQKSTSIPPTLGEAILFVGKKSLQIVISGTPSSDSARAMIREVNTRLLPTKALLYADHSAGQAYLAQRLEFLQSILPGDNTATAFVCENYVCQMPAKTPAALAKQLDARR